MIVGVLVPDLGNPVFVPFLRGVQHVAQSHGYSVLVVDAQRSGVIEKRALDRLRAHGVDALVLAGPARDAARVAELRRAGVVVMDPDTAEPSGGSLIAELELPGTVAMCEALSDLGHRRVAYVSREKVPGGAGQRRWKAMSQRLEELGVQLRPVALGRRQEPSDVAELLTRVLRRPERISAIVCSTHGLAPTVLRGLDAAGIDVPGECSFVTYGDSEWAEAFRPAISAVSLDLFEVAVTMTATVLRNVVRDASLPAYETPPVARFLRRESVGQAQAAPLSFY
jgi:LacI family transcriptional regulator